MGTRGRGRCQAYGRADAPTGLWKTAQTRFPTPPTAIIERSTNTERKTQTAHRDHFHWRRTPDNLSRSSTSLRSDHDAVVPVITMAWTA
jgi:hypothetical protein